MRIVLDTNVLVSGLLSKGKPWQVLTACVTGGLTPILDPRILGEYLDVLSRPHLHIPPDVREAVLDALEGRGELIFPEPLDLPLPDPSDLPFLETAVSGRADALVTGNLRDFPPHLRRGIPVLNPAAFLAHRDPPR